MPIKPDHLKPFTVNLEPDQLEFLESRGARPDKGRGARGIAPTIRRGIDFLREALADISLPLKENELALLRTLFPDPWSADVEFLHHLPHLVPIQKNYATLARAQDIDPQQFPRRLERLSFLARLKILDYLQVAATHLSGAGGRPADDEE